MDTLPPDDLIVLDSVFKKYDTDNSGYLDLKQFTLFLVRLGKHVKELRKVTILAAEAVFALIDKDTDGKIDFHEFCKWWNTDASQRYGYFTGEKGKLLRKSYNLYYKYSSSSDVHPATGVSSPNKNSGMTIVQFERMMDTLGIEYTEGCFDALDDDNDGVISFEEFCRWLNWF
ncbi:MAG: EF-hand domain-containing protein [Magnetovibrio sp.]|nr:EF-hand domain-containing protein [Magnetovibrio sp.]